VSLGAAPGSGLSVPGEAAADVEFPPLDGGKILAEIMSPCPVAWSSPCARRRAKANQRTC